MALRDIVFRAVDNGRRRIGMEPRNFDFNAFFIAPDEAMRTFPGAPGSLNEVFFSHQGRIIHKWLHYLDIYQRHFAAFQNTPVKMLEIGVFKGGSLEMWRKYFGMQATIFGIDVNPECASYVTPPNQVRIGSQADPNFLRSVAGEIGELDIVLDDGSHVASHQRISFDTLFPLLHDGGLYVIEDMHTAYFSGIYGGGYRRKGTAIEFVKSVIDDMHAWYHTRATSTPAKQRIGGVHVYDSIAIIEKRKVERPCNTKVGAPMSE